MVGADPSVRPLIRNSTQNEAGAQASRLWCPGKMPVLPLTLLQWVYSGKTTEHGSVHR